MLMRLSRETWIKKLFAKTANGEATDPCNPEACQFCVAGFIAQRFPNIVERVNMRKRFDELASGCIIGFNDHPARSWEDIVKLFTDAGYPELVEP